MLMNIMETKVQKQIIDYFTYFEEFYNKSKTYLRDCQNCAVSINKLIKRCKNLKRADVTDTPLEEYQEVPNILYASIHNLISEEIQELRTLLSTIEELFDKLVHKKRTFVESSKDINLEDTTLLVKGTPLQPPLKQLLEFAEETITFGSQLCRQIEIALEVLTFKQLETESFVENFRISSDWLLSIPEIIAYTSFVSENQI